MTMPEIPEPTEAERKVWADVVGLMEFRAQMWNDDDRPVLAAECQGLAEAFRAYLRGDGVPSMTTLRVKRRSAETRAEVAEAEVERLRKGVEALADEWEHDWDRVTALGRNDLAFAVRHGAARRIRAVLSRRGEPTEACCVAGTPLAGPGVLHEVGCTRAEEAEQEVHEWEERYHEQAREIARLREQLFLTDQERIYQREHKVRMTDKHRVVEAALAEERAKVASTYTKSDQWLAEARASVEHWKTRHDAAEAEVKRLTDLLAACPLGNEEHSCCDCRTPAEVTLSAIEAMVAAAEERSPIGAKFDREHPDITASVLIPVRDLRPILSRRGEHTEQGAELSDLLDAPAVGRCTACRRQTWDAADVGRECNMPQPDATRCRGRFIQVVTTDG